MVKEIQQKIVDAVTQMIKSEPLSDIDYVEMYKLPGLLPVDEVISGKVLLALLLNLVLHV